MKLDEDLGPLLSFLPPILADKSMPSVQVFFRTKDVLNGASKELVLVTLGKALLKDHSL